MYPDLMDVTRAQQGAAIEGAFSAVWLFGQKVANALAPLALGLMLQAAGWQASTAGVTAQSDQALNALRTELTLVPAAIFVAGGLGLWLIYRPLAKHVASHR
jgi:GPH family glycoside/pentoside/hexuronide:cation symporter